MIRTTASRQIILAFAGLIVFVFLCVRFVFAPVYSHYRTLYDQENTYRSEIGNNIEIIKSRDAITGNYKLIMEKYGVQEKDESVVIRTKQEIDEICKGRVSLPKIQDLPAEDKGFYREYFFQLDCNGSPQQIGSLIYALGRSSMLFMFYRIRLQHAGQQAGGKENEVKAVIKLSRICFPETEKKPEPEQPAAESPAEPPPADREEKPAA
jgi:hypothetical protein